MNRDYNKESQNLDNKLYAYNFDLDIMHHYMMETFYPFFKEDDVLELGCSRGDFTRRLWNVFSDITCVEASIESIDTAKEKLPNSIIFVNDLFEDVKLEKKYNNIVMTHVLEHLDNPIKVLKRINNEWLTEEGKVFIACPNANAPSRQIAVKMGIISHNSAITESEKEHGHKITYSLDTLQRDVRESGLKILQIGGIFFKGFSNFQWDKILKNDIVSKEFIDGCFQLGKHYPDLCASIYVICEKGDCNEI